MKACAVLTLIVACFIGTQTLEAKEATEDTSAERSYRYCKHASFVNHASQYTCRTGFKGSPNAACVGGVMSSIDKKNIDKVDEGYTSCNDGALLTRVRLKTPKP